jgi:flagellar basal-body rod protein FlgG
MRLSLEGQLRTLQERIDIIANNMANINTTGFKASMASLVEAYDVQEQTANLALYGGIPNGAALGVGTGALYHGKRIDMSQGIITKSDNSWDIAINGQGFFQVKTLNGDTAYTRAGTLHLDKNGLLINNQGDSLQPAVTIPDVNSNVQIKSNGEIVNMVDGKQEVIGQIQLANFVNIDGLKQIGDSLFLATPQSGPPQTGIPGSGEFGEIKSGAIEQSNVDYVTAITSLMQAQRAYQMDARQLKQVDEMWAQANALRR